MFSIMFMIVALCFYSNDIVVPMWLVVFPVIVDCLMLLDIARKLKHDKNG